MSTPCGSEFYLNENKEGWTEIAQVATLSAHWDKTIATPIVLVTHIPLLTSFFQATAGHEEAAPRNRVVVNAREVLDCFAKHRLHLVLQGHLHVNEMLRWRGTTFITGGAVCGQRWRGWRALGPGSKSIHVRSGCEVLEECPKSK